METTEKNQTERRFADKKTLAQRYAVSERTITNWRSAGLLVSIKIRRVLRFDIPACDAALRQHGFTNHLCKFMKLEIPNPNGLPPEGPKHNQPPLEQPMPKPEIKITNLRGLCMASIVVWPQSGPRRSQGRVAPSLTYPKKYRRP